MAVKIDSFEDELRRAIYGGIVSRFCATCGWLTWLFVQALAKDWKAIFGPIVGVLVGVTVRFVEHYKEVARYESEGGDWSEEEEESEGVPKGFARGIVQSLVPFVLLFVALTCEHVLGDLLAEYMVPFLASIATLFPVGAIFGSLVQSGRRDEGLRRSFLARSNRRISGRSRRGARRLGDGRRRRSSGDFRLVDDPWHLSFVFRFAVFPFSAPRSRRVHCRRCPRRHLQRAEFLPLSFSPSAAPNQAASARRPSRGLRPRCPGRSRAFLNRRRGGERKA